MSMPQISSLQSLCPHNSIICIHFCPLDIIVVVIFFLFLCPIPRPLVLSLVLTVLKRILAPPPLSLDDTRMIMEGATCIISIHIPKNARVETSQEGKRCERKGSHIHTRRDMWRWKGTTNQNRKHNNSPHKARSQSTPQDMMCRENIFQVTI